MKLRIAACLIIFFASLSVHAQKKEISSARDNLKKGTKLEDVEKSMTKLLADSANRGNVKVWDCLFESLKKQYQAANEKLYLKQKQDTAALFSIASRMFTYMESYDSIDARADEKGRVKLQYRKQNGELLNTLRPNLYNGGRFYVMKQKWGDAYALLHQYLNAAEQPLFDRYNYADKDTLMSEVAYWAVYAAYKQKNAAGVHRYAPLAQQKADRKEAVMQYLCETYWAEKDTTRYCQTLHEGFNFYPRSTFFYPLLVDYYTADKRWQEALTITESAIASDSTNHIYPLTKASLLVNLGQYELAFDICDSLIQHGDTVPEAQLHAGLAKFNIGVTLDKSARTAKEKKAMMNTYRQALPYLEAYRKARPDRKDAWGLPLYTIYLNLNMGKEFDEIDRQMKQ